MASRKNNVFISDLTVDKVKVNSSLINNKELVSIGPLICHNTLSVHLDSKIDGVLAVDGGTYIDNILSVHGPVFVRDETLFSLLDVRDVYYYLENTYFERYISVAEGMYSNSLGVKMNSDMGGNLSIGGPLFISSYQSIALNSDILGSQRIGENISINGLSFITEQLSIGGDTYINNTLSVESAVTLHDTLSVDGLFTLHDNMSINGYATLHDTLSVGENVYLNYDLSIGHDVYIEGYLSVNNIATFQNKLSVADDSYISKTLSVQENVYLSNKLSIYGDTNIFNTLSIGDITYINSSLSITDNLFVEDQLSIQSCVYIQDSLSIGNNSYNYGDISIQGDSYLKGIISVNGFSTFVDTISLGDIAYLSQELSISGHTNIRDTLSVNDNVYLKSKLSVNDNIILKSDLSVDGLSYLKNSISVYDNAYFVNKLSVYDNIITSNNLSVSNNTYLQSNISINQNSFMNGKLSVNDIVHFNNSLSVNGVFVASNKLSIAGDTYIRDNLSISSNIFVRSKLSVFQAVHMSNNLSVQGLVYSQNQLSVFGQTTINDKLSVSGRTFLSDTLSVSNNSYLNSQLSVFGSTTMNDLLSVSNRTFLSNTLSVAGIQYNLSKLSISGDTNIKDTLSVSSNVYLNTKLSVSGDTNIKDTLSISGIIYDSNQLSVFGQTTLNDKLSVSGRTFLSDTLSVNNISYLKNQLSVFGSATMNDLLSVSNRTFLSNTLSVAGIQYNLSKLSISGDTNIKDTLSIAGNVYLNTKLSVSGDTNIKDSLSISGIIYDSNQLSVFGQTTLNDKLSVSGKVFLNDTLSVYNIGYLKNQLSILGMTTIGDILSVNGSSFIKNTLSVFDSVTLNNSLSVYGNARIDGLTLIDDDLSVSGIIYGDKEISIGGVGYMTNSLSVNGRLIVIGDIDITGSFFNNGILQNTNSSTVWLFGPSNSLYYVAGNIGIGTIVPAYKLDVRGGDTFLQGNSFIQGRLSVSNRLFVGNQLSVFGDTIIQNTLSVGSRTALLSTLDVSGQTNIKNNLSVFGPSFINNSLSIVGPFINGSYSSINGSFFSNSNLSIQGNATVSSSISVNGASYINNLLSISNDLQVGRYLTVSNLSKFNNGVQITNLTTMNGKLSVNGDATISSYLSIGDDAYFKKKTTIDGDTRINGATYTKNVTTDGFHYIKNNVSIGGIATIDDSLIVNFDTLIGNYVSIGNDTNVNTNLYAGNLGVTGTVSINGSENVYGDVFINGHLSVNSPIYLNGDTNNSNQYTSGTISVNSDLYVNNNLDVNNNTTLHNTLSVYGTFFLEDQLSVGYPAWIDSNLIVSNDTNLNNNVYIQGNSELKGTLSINNNLTIKGATSISGDTFIDGSLNVGKKLTTKGIISNGNVDISGNQRNFGYISISSDGVIDGSLYVRNRLSISNIATLANKLSVGGDTYLSSNLSVYNTAYINGLLSVNNLTYLSGTISIGNNEYILTDLSIGGSEYLANNISIAGSSYFKGVVDLSNNLVLRNHLSVYGNSYMNGVLSIAGNSFMIGVTDLSNVVVRNNLSVSKNIFIQDSLSIQNNIFTNNINSANNQNININSNLKFNNSNLLNVNDIIGIDNSPLYIDGSGASSSIVLRVNNSDSLKINSNNNVIINNNLSVNGSQYINNSLSINGQLYSNSNLSISGIVKVNNNILLNKSTIDNVYAFDMSGNARVDGDLHVSGNLTVDGSSVVINTESLTVVDGVIQLAANNTLSDNLPIGIIGHYSDASNVVTHSGFVRSPNTKDWWLVNNYPTNITTSFTGTDRNNLSTFNVGDIKTNNIVSRGNTDISGVLTALNYAQHNWSSTKLGNPSGSGNIGSDASGILIKLATLSTNSDPANGGSLYIHGTIGSFGGNGSGIISLSISTRTSVYITGSLFVQDYATCQQRNDFMLYQEADSTYSLYIRCFLSNKFDFMVSGNGLGITLLTPNYTSTTTPTGTLYTIGGNYSLLKQCLITYNNGSVGIGTTAPSQKLDVNGNINFNGSLYQNGTLYVSSQWGTNVNDIYYTNGKVGIGSTTPSAPLHVFSNTTGYTPVLRLQSNVDDYNTNHGARLDFYTRYTGNSSSYYQASLVGTTVPGFNDSGRGALRFLVNNANSELEAMRVNWNGYVGIGTTNPGVNLDVSGSIFSGENGSMILRKTAGYNNALSITPFMVIGQNDYDKNFNLVTSYGFRYGALIGQNGKFYISSASSSSYLGKYSSSQNYTDVMVFDSSYVGIGTTSPTTELDVNGYLRVWKRDTNGTSLAIGDNQGGFVIAKRPDPGVGNKKTLGISWYDSWANNTNYLFNIDSSFNVGVGTVAPLGKLHVNSSLGENVIFEHSRFNGYASLYMLQNAIGSWRQQVFVTSDPLQLSAFTISNANGNITNAKTATYNEVFRIDSSGNVGIGTNNPSSKLQVAGKTISGIGGATTITDSNDSLYLENSSATANYSQMHLYYNDPSGAINGFLSMNKTGWSDGIGNSFPALNLWTGSAHGIKFGTNGATRMMITSGGNIGIGTTNPSSTLHLYNTNTNEIYVTSDTTGETFSSLRLKNSGASQGILFFNSTTRTGDGGANTLTLRNDAGTLRLQSTGPTVTGANTGIEITGSNVNIGYKALNTSLVTISGLTIGTTSGSLKNGYNSTSSYASSIYTWNIGALAGYGYIDIAGDGNTTMNISGLYKFYPNTYYKISITAKANKTSSACYLEAPNSSYTFGNSFTMTTSYQTFTFEGITSSALAYDGAGTYNNNMRFAIYDSSKNIIVNINAFSVQTMSVNGNGLGGVKMMNDNAKIIIGDGVSNVGDQGLEINSGWINSSNYNEHVPLRVQTKGNNAFLVNTNGFVGIGTTNPSGAKLDIYHNNTNVLQISNLTNSNCALTIVGHQLGALSSITQKSAASTDLSLQLYNQTPYASYSGGTTESFIFYQKNSGGGISSPLYITRDLNVIAYQIGIGTNNPQNNLHVAYTNAVIRIGNHTVGTAADTTTYGLERSRNSIYFSGFRDTVANKIGSKIVSINKQTYFGADKSAIQSTDLAFFTTSPNTLNIDDTVERFRITDSGNVGIGTDNPVASLTLNGTSATNGIVLTNGSLNDATRSISAGIVSNEICGLSSMTTNGAGADAGQLRLSAGGGTTWYQKTFIDMYGYGANTANSYMALGTAGTERMRIQYGGNIGIGTTNPGELLDIRGNLRVGGSDTANYIAFRGTTGDSPGTFSHTYIGEYVYGGTEQSELLLFKGNDMASTAGPDRIRLFAAEHRFDTYTTETNGTFTGIATSTSNNRMIITNGGKVGIGSSSPGFPLTIGYSGTNTLATSPNKNFGLEIYNSNASGNQNTPNLILFTDYNTTQGAIGGYRENYNAHYRSGLVFYTNNQPVGYVLSQPGNTTNASNSLTEMMRINPDGNVGIGTNNPQSALHVVGARNYGPGITKGIHMGEAGTNDYAIEIVGVTANCNTYIDFTTPGVDYYGRILYLHGTSGNAMTFSTNSSERMRIDSVGNVGIGTNPSLKLHINGYAGIESTYSLEFGVNVAKTTDCGRIGYNTYDSPALCIVGAHPSDTTDRRVRLWDKLGIGINPSYPIHINGSNTTFYYDWYAAWISYPDTTGFGWGTFDGRFQATFAVGIGIINAFAYSNYGFIAASDKRIKKDIVDATDCLQITKKIRVRNYNYIDTRRGTHYAYGVIAQELFEVFPEAVNKQTESIPSIYQFARQVNISNLNIDNDASGIILDITIDSSHNLVLNDTAIIIFEGGNEDENYKVVNVSDLNKFSIKVDNNKYLPNRDQSGNIINIINYLYDSDNNIVYDKNNNIIDLSNCIFDSSNNLIGVIGRYPNIFVYGKVINDFMAVDKTRLATLALGAINELDNKVENKFISQEEQINTLQTTVDCLQQIINDLQTTVQTQTQKIDSQQQTINDLQTQLNNLTQMFQNYINSHP